MENEIEVQKSFQEKMKDRIRESIGDLISDEELTKLIHKGVEDVFLLPIKEKRGWNNGIEHPSLLHGLLKELLTDQVRNAVTVYITEHSEEVTKSIHEVISNGMAKALIGAISMRFTNELISLQANIENNLGR